MATVFLATLGQRPEAITMAYDLLATQYAYHTIGIIHTEPYPQGIADALHEIRQVLRRDYPHIQPIYHRLTRHDGTPLFDIVDRFTAEDYRNGILDVIQSYQSRRDRVHLLISGGRKAMSAYATLAATATFTRSDKLWAILSSPDIVQMRGMYHLPESHRAFVEMVQLPVLPVRQPDSHPIAREALHAALRRRAHPGQDFRSRLSKAEDQLVDALLHEPYATVDTLAALLHKSPKTIEKQFTSIYKKLHGFLEYPDGSERSKPRQLLLDLLKEDVE